MLLALVPLTGCPEPDVLQQPPESASMPPPIDNRVPLPAVAIPIGRDTITPPPGDTRHTP